MTHVSALQVIRARAPGCTPTVAVILGSGWGALSEHITHAVRIPYADLDGFPVSTVPGHSGDLVLGNIGEQSVAVMSGRKHGYESGTVDGMKLPLQVLRALGCNVLVQTNAAGSLRPHLPPHTVAVLTDHLNLPQRSPLVGELDAERFVSMLDAYDPPLRSLAQNVASELQLKLPEAVYAWAFGPQFETPAEIRMLAQLGADLVGMSTVPETIMARYLGMRVLALSLVTNMGAGLSTEPLSHAHTLSQAQASSAAVSALLASVIKKIRPALPSETSFHATTP